MASRHYTSKSGFFQGSNAWSGNEKCMHLEGCHVKRRIRPRVAEEFKFVPEISGCNLLP